MIRERRRLWRARSCVVTDSSRAESSIYPLVTTVTDGRRHCDRDRRIYITSDERPWACVGRGMAVSRLAGPAAAAD